MSFACADVWPHLQPRDHRSILSRGIFDSLVVRQLRLRRDVREYLAGCWLQRVYLGDGAPRKLKKYLLARNGGRDIVLASRASLSMLLAMREPTLLDEVLRRNPMLFLSETLVAGFSEEARVRALESCVIELVRGADLPGRGWGTDAVILRAFVFPDALAKLKVLWGAHADSNESVRVLLLWILCEANGHACADEALTAALHLSWGEQTQQVAIRALHVANDGRATMQFLNALLAEMKLTDKGWTVPELEAGLSKQLVGQYLRHDSCRHGIYVLIRQRKKAWTVAGRRLSFEQLITRLSEQAERIEQNSTRGVRVKVLPTVTSD